MLPVIALIGRPNVGKSTLFNRLTRSRDALVADYPGLTRDRKYGFGKLGPVPYLVIDTGGVAGGEVGIYERMVAQTVRALQEADVTIVLVDGRSGLTPADEHVAELARRNAKNTWLAVNKAEGLDAAIASGEFHGLGLGEPVAISAAHGDRISALMDEVLAPFADAADETEEDAEDDKKPLRIAVIGRPNVGKSTLINRLAGEERVVAFDQPGTTRDTISVPFERRGKPYTLIDTAGVRRRGKVQETIEKFSVIKALEAIEKANVVIVVIDARDGLTDQDMTLLGYVVDSGRALVIAINKCDGLDSDQRDKNRSTLERRLVFVSFAAQHFISARHGTGVGDLMSSVDQAYASAFKDLNTRYLTDLLEEAVFKHNPPLHHGRRVKLRYAHQGGRNPPIVVVHGNQTQHLPEVYRRYLINFFINKLKLKGTPLRIELKSGKNPFSGKKGAIKHRK